MLAGGGGSKNQNIQNHFTSRARGPQMKKNSKIASRRGCLAKIGEAMSNAQE
jgi:hypothetical protein